MSAENMILDCICLPVLTEDIVGCVWARRKKIQTRCCQSVFQAVIHSCNKDIQYDYLSLLWPDDWKKEYVAVIPCPIRHFAAIPNSPNNFFYHLHVNILLGHNSKPRSSLPLPCTLEKMTDIAEGRIGGILQQCQQKI